MFKIKKLLLTILIISWLHPFLHAKEDKSSSIYYVKLGGAHPPGDSYGVLPTFGVGARFQRDFYGFDLSANLSSIVFINYAALRGIFLYYPYPEKKDQFYFGGGPGINYCLSSVPMGGPFGSTFSESASMNLEGMLGYEFRHTPYFKTFVQLEASQPVVQFSKGNRDYQPGIALTAGIGF